MSEPVPLPAPTKGDETRISRWRKDIIAGLINAVVSVPDGLASAALAGINPVYGLYTSITKPIAGSLLVSAQLMQISTTTASALAAGQAVMSYPSEQREQSLFLLVVLVGVFPPVGDAKRPVVILRLRGYTRVGATLIEVLDEYADELAEAGGRLYLSGVDKKSRQAIKERGQIRF